MKLKGTAKYSIVFLAAALLMLAIWINLKPSAKEEKLNPFTESVQNSQELALTWLLHNQTEDGLFLYNFKPNLDEIPKRSNALRQLMASRVAAEAANSSEEWLAVHRKNLDFIFDNWYQEDEQGGYVEYQNKSKLGANAMLLRTLVYSPDFDDYKKEAEAVAKGIMSLQQEDGSFRAWYREPDYDYDEDYLLNFYSGEAMLALLEYSTKTGDQASLEAATKAADFYLIEYVVEIKENYHPAYVPWHTMAYYHLYQLSGDQKYAGAIFILNDRLIELVDEGVFSGRFFKQSLVNEGQTAPHSSSDAVYLEGLIYAYEVAADLDYSDRAIRYKQIIDLATKRLSKLQYREGRDGFMADPDRYLGAIPIHETNPEIRVDTTQHTIDALTKYLEVFGK